ncbi:MAG: hypothetical protein LBE91_15095 [Tannerella sp.]|jgi:serine/threonine-protein kinase HipA|nr:hypothetical protein [Tannerella sp.]
MAQQTDIYVYMDWNTSDKPVLTGVLRHELIRGKDVFSFENDPAWLKKST